MWEPTEISRHNVGQVNSHGAVLKDRWNQSAKIGVIISCWSNIERTLSEINGYVVEAEGWTAAEAIDDIRKFNRKLDLVLGGIRTNLSGDLRGRALTALNKKQMLKLAKTRNKLAHGVFITLNLHPDSVVRQAGHGKKERWYLYNDKLLDEILLGFETKLNEVALLLLQIAGSTAPRYEPGRMIFPHQTWGHPEPRLSFWRRLVNLILSSAASRP